MAVDERIVRGRTLLDEGKEKQACRELTDAIDETHDLPHTIEIRKLAERGLATAGFLAKGRWNELLRLCDARRQDLAA